MSEQPQVADTRAASAADTGPASAGDTGHPPKTYLVWSVLVSALLFLPIGLVALAFSIRTDVLVRRGELEGARRTSRVSLVLVIVTAVVGVIVYAVVIGALLALGAFSGAE